MNQKMIRIEHHNNVAIVKLDRNVTNALNLELVNELAETIQKVKHDSDVYSLVLSSSNEKFFAELEKVAQEIHRILKPNKIMGWVIGDHWRKKSGFIPVGIKLYQRLCKYFETIDIVCLTRRNQSSNTSIWHRRAQQFNFYLRGFKYLFIMQKSK